MVVVVIEDMMPTCTIFDPILPSLHPQHAVIRVLFSYPCERCFCILLPMLFVVVFQMTHFTSNLHNYMMFEVLENSWTEFQTECNRAQNLDHLIGSHFQYLDQISRKTLISGCMSVFHDPRCGVCVFWRGGFFSMTIGRCFHDYLPVSQGDARSQQLNEQLKEVFCVITDFCRFLCVPWRHEYTILTFMNIHEYTIFT